MSHLNSTTEEVETTTENSQNSREITAGPAESSSSGSTAIQSGSSGEEVAQIEHFAEQLVDHMAKDQQATNHHQNSDHTTFHPISTEGLQVNKRNESLFRLLYLEISIVYCLEISR